MNKIVVEPTARPVIDITLSPTENLYRTTQAEVSFWPD
jgi:fructose-1,6-bisphosphatase/sedoheptulose 1,7-bisphosphatase-like protein